MLCGLPLNVATAARMRYRDAFKNYNYNDISLGIYRRIEGSLENEVEDYRES